MNDTYFLRIKKDYAAAVIEDLQKMEAVELIDEHNFAVPDWHKEKVLEAKKQAEQNPSLLMDWNTVKSSLKNK